MTNESRHWLRFAGLRTYHRTGPDYIWRGLSACGRFDLTRTGFELIDGETTEPVDRRFKRCKLCLATQTTETNRGK
jgi:hypothetical protein